ncbi:MAG: hypothetical protein ACXAD7_06315, partial [Candidatus Kariarchaeaceae archaeon]
MKLYSIIVADLLTGNVLHTINYGKFEKDATQMLFTSAMSGIQILMNELKVGTVKTITTDEYQIT